MRTIMNLMKLSALVLFAGIFVGCERPIVTPELPQTDTKVENKIIAEEVGTVRDEANNANQNKRRGGGKESYNNGPVVIIVIEDTHFKQAGN
ncbi:MAG: hypothetical protein ACKVTZ_13645 [Bacteroidia bacterium]